jgi:hypothetical protein
MQGHTSGRLAELYVSKSWKPEDDLLCLGYRNRNGREMASTALNHPKIVFLVPRSFVIDERRWYWVAIPRPHGYAVRR